MRSPNNGRCRQKYSRLLQAICGVITCMACTAAAETLIEEPEGNLTFILSAPKTQYVVGEPIVAQFKLINQAYQPAARFFRDSKDFAHADFEVMMEAVDDSITPIVPLKSNFGAVRLWPQTPLHMRRPPTIGPGEFWQCEKTFLPAIRLGRARRSSGPSWGLVPEGRYTLRANVLLLGPKEFRSYVESEPFVIEYKEPVGVDAEALKLLSTTEPQSGFFNGSLGSQPDVIRALLLKYPESTYARYARARISLDHAREFLGSTGAPSPLSPAQKARADEIASEALAYVREFPDMLLSDNILLSCARVQERAGKKEEAVQTLKRIISEYGDSDACEAAKELLGRQPGPSPEVLLRLRERNEQTTAIVVPPTRSDDASTDASPARYVHPGSSHAASRPAGTSTTQPAGTRPAGATATQPAVGAASRPALCEGAASGK